MVGGRRPLDGNWVFLYFLLDVVRLTKTALNIFIRHSKHSYRSLKQVLYPLNFFFHLMKFNIFRTSSWILFLKNGPCPFSNEFMKSVYFFIFDDNLISIYQAMDMGDLLISVNSLYFFF